MKNKKLLINAFNLLEFLAYECELSLYSQIATKEFLFKISGLLMNKDVDPIVFPPLTQGQGQNHANHLLLGRTIPTP